MRSVPLALVSEPCEEPWRDAAVRWPDLYDVEYDYENDDDLENRIVTSPTTFSYSYPHPDQNKQETIDIELQGFDMDSEPMWCSTGLTAWPAADVLCRYISENADTMTGNQRILELGSGLGLCGILAHQYCSTSDNKANHIYLTDGDTDTLRFLRKNVERNVNEAVDHDNNTMISCHQLIWGRDNAKEFLARSCQSQTFDLLLASDIVYARRVVQPLWETVQTLLAKPNGQFLMAYRTGRISFFDSVLRSAKDYGFAYDVIVEHTEEERGDGQRVKLYCFRWAKFNT